MGDKSPKKREKKKKAVKKAAVPTIETASVKKPKK